ncbi:MAG: MmgE/PrpD family protein [Deltaproteobacteria bacterium]|nr:MmgE/PrpD family protein [Deltaproteobacteria bacterium]
MTTQDIFVTQEAAAFTAGLKFHDLPAEALRIAKRCVLDGLGLILAGSDQTCTAIIQRQSLHLGNNPEATALGAKPVKLPAPLAALVNGTAGHAMDWDDTQLSVTPDRIYGLLTHPTIPPLTAGLAMAERLGGVSGRDFLTAFLAGFEVECKIAEAIRPDHYKHGFHTSGTVGTFGAAITAGKLLGLPELQLRHTMGTAASLAAGIRVNFGTMMKPVHVGRAAFNGLSAALWAADGFEASPDGLDGPWGFFQVCGGGVDSDKIVGRFGRPHTIVDPGVSIKPYPCGVLTHPSMDAMLALVKEYDLRPDDVAEVVLFAGYNILNPIRYQIAQNELQAKFCMPFLLSAMLTSRRAGVKEFTDQYVNAAPLQAMMRRVRTEFDPSIEAKGYEKIRSRVEVVLKDGRKLSRDSGEAYRGGPDNPLSDQDLQAKFTDCSEKLLDAKARQEVFAAVAGLENLRDMKELISLLTFFPNKERPAKLASRP